MAWGTRPQQGVDVELILQTIRTLESHNNYAAQNPRSTASGAYQILNTTWARFGGYNRAVDAPPAVQDDKARQMVLEYLRRSNNDVSAIPQYWYIGHTGAPYNYVPPGNTISVGDYTKKWMKLYNAQGGANPGQVINLNPNSVQDIAAEKPGQFKEHCILKAPGVDLKIITIGKNCLLSSNQARAIAGATFVAIGGLVLVGGITLLVLGEAKIPSVPGSGLLKNNLEDRQFARAEAQGRENQANAPFTSGGGKRMLARSEEPF